MPPSAGLGRRYETTSGDIPSVAVTGTKATIGAAPSRRPPPAYVTDGVASVLSSGACVMTSDVRPLDAAMLAVVSVTKRSSPMVIVDVSPGTALPEESRVATLWTRRCEPGCATSPSTMRHGSAFSVPESTPPSKVTTVSVRLRASAANGRPYDTSSVAPPYSTPLESVIVAAGATV